jgi:hypothetical protein
MFRLRHTRVENVKARQHFFQIRQSLPTFGIIYNVAGNKVLYFYAYKQLSSEAKNENTSFYRTEHICFALRNIWNARGILKLLLVSMFTNSSASN